MNILISLLRNNADSTRKKSESSGRERSPRWEHSIHGNSTQPYNVPKGFPHGHWRFMLAVVALLSGFTFSPLEECIRCIVLTQGDLSEFTASCVLPGGVVFPIACSQHKQQSKKENFFWIIELLPSGNTLSLWFWVCLVINKDIWEVLFARHQEFGIQGWDVDVSPFKGWIESIHLSTQVAEHLLCAG